MLSLFGFWEYGVEVMSVCFLVLSDFLFLLPTFFVGLYSRNNPLNGHLLLFRIDLISLKVSGSICWILLRSIRNRSLEATVSERARCLFSWRILSI